MPDAPQAELIEFAGPEGVILGPPQQHFPAMPLPKVSLTMRAGRPGRGAGPLARRRRTPVNQARTDLTAADATIRALRVSNSSHL